MTAGSERVRAARIGALAVALAFTGLAITVHFNYGGNWTGLFCTGSRFRIPPWLSREHVYVFADSWGYDGQFYHYIAHDPFLARDTAAYIDAPRLRYRRILVPLAAWVLSAGGRAWLHGAYIAVMLGFVFLGAYWLSGLAMREGRHPAWGLGFLAIPGVVVSLDRMTVDGALGALTAGLLWCLATGCRTALYLVLAAACLLRETGLLLVASCVVAEAQARRWKQALLWASASLPAWAWYLYVHAHTRPDGAWVLTLPLFGLLERFTLPPGYRMGGNVLLLIRMLDWVALAGVFLTVVLAVQALWRRRDAPAFAMMAYLLLLVTLKAKVWEDAYGYARIMAPLLVLLVGGPWRMSWERRWLPIGLLLPRVGAQLSGQLLGVLRGLFG